MNLETGKPFDDGEHILYVNGAYRGDSALGQLMHDFSCHDADDMYYDELADRTRYFKETPEGVNEMCKAMEDMRTDALNRGIEIGMAQGMERGMAQGMEQGMAKGEDLFAKLVALLLQNNRSEDVARAAADADYRHDLFVKYNLS